MFFYETIQIAMINKKKVMKRAKKNKNIQNQKNSNKEK